MYHTKEKTYLLLLKIAPLTCSKWWVSIQKRFHVLWYYIHSYSLATISRFLLLVLSVLINSPLFWLLLHLYLFSFCRFHRWQQCMQYLAFWVYLILLNMMLASSTHFPERNDFILRFGWLKLFEGGKRWPKMIQCRACIVRWNSNQPISLGDLGHRWGFSWPFQFTYSFEYLGRIPSSARAGSHNSVYF